MTAAFGNFNVNEMNMDINMDLNGTRAKQISKTSPQVVKFENQGYDSFGGSQRN